MVSIIVPIPIVGKRTKAAHSVRAQVSRRLETTRVYGIVENGLAFGAISEGLAAVRLDGTRRRLWRSHAPERF